jgi:hypothetical protein
MHIKETKHGSRKSIDIIIELLKSSIEKYQVQTIGMKIVSPYQVTKVLTDLYSEIRQLACNTGIFLSMYEMETLRKLSGGNHPNKRSLFRHLALTFPELETPYHKGHRMRNIRAFEALACALI